MLGLVSEDENHNKIFKPMAGATLGQGVPLGAWCSFEKDVAPSDNWLVAGTTFDASVYPALNLYLGTNKVPSRYDHNRPSDYETISTTGFSPWTAPYDAVLIYCGDAVISVNGEIICISTTGTNKANTLEVKKGDVVTLSSLGSQVQIKVAYYKHPLFIKATSIASDSDQQAILAQIQAYNTYSTEETLTGKTWIDGKPIYRKCYSGLTISFTNQENWQSLGITAPLNVDTITDGILYGADVTAPYSAHDIPFCNCLVAIGNNNTLYRWNTLNAGVIHSVVIEYTKTND